MIIKKKFVMLAALSALMCSTSALATYRVDVQCLDQVMLTDVHAGYIKSPVAAPTPAMRWSFHGKRIMSRAARASMSSKT